jgi:hypothetical protein
MLAMGVLWCEKEIEGEALLRVLHLEYTNSHASGILIVFNFNGRPFIGFLVSSKDNKFRI